ncbi:MAG: class I adenylate-forming enzyme family protein [Eubacteriales bacterium]|nr:class I adenylate-forming enzyme family protein [Eubacteriales bacterium]
MIPRSIVESIALHSADPEYRDKLCIADRKNELTYMKAWEHILSFRKKLLEAGFSKGDYAAVYCTQDVRYLIAIMAVSAAGGVYLPIEKGASAERMADIRTDSGTEYYIGLKPDNTFRVNVSIKDTLEEPDVTETPDESEFPEPGDASEILYSTGTTGKSKGIVLTHSTAIALAENVIYGTEMKKDNIELIPMPLSHSHGLRRTYGNLLNGSSVIFVNGVTLIKPFFDLLEKYKATAIDMAPAILSMIFKLSGDKLGDYRDQLDYIQLGSAPLPEEDKLHLMKILPDTRLYNFYGTTESGCSCILDFNDGVERERSIGKPTKNAVFIFADKDRKPVKATKDHPAFIATAGVQNMTGYLNNPDLTASVMEGGYIYTNDLGYRDKDGYIYCLGREDDVINCGGVKIAPDEIEDEANKFEGVKDSCCVPVKDELQGQAPKLYISITDGLDADSFDIKGLRKYLKGVLDANKMPVEIEIIDEIPRTYNGKLLRRKLRQD